MVTDGAALTFLAKSKESKIESSKVPKRIYTLIFFDIFRLYIQMIL